MRMKTKTRCRKAFGLVSNLVVVLEHLVDTLQGKADGTVTREEDQRIN
jgi:hypothetical protein